MLKLQFKDHSKAAIWLVDSRYSMGRDKSNDIVLDEDGISNFHAELRVEDDDRIFITDAGSITGTFVNGKQIKARTQLRAGDVLRLNTSELHLVDPKEQLKAQPEDSATAISPALQGLNASVRPGSGPGVGGVPVGWLLRGKTGSIAGEAFPIPPTGRAILGRSQGCDIVLPGTHVSRQHAELYFQSGRLHVKDLGSSNGTYVNRRKVQEGVVNPGDELRFDTLVFQVEAPEAPVVAEQEGGDKTMFRPAVSVSAQPAAGATPAKPAAPPPQPARPVAAKPAPRPVANPVAQPEPAKSKGVMIAGIGALAVAAVAAWMLLG
ncbi:FHA domain-containing protein [Alcanivorax sp. 1008]|uniref:FHA domain-containing protein n=1 Tax=Alcanivorax sp. 1008 TaxID=2816853 RepID=UPI001DA1F49B|nr:FHA domain-containing protein [Alcanivorax sp. 1008]MCC1497515.1 FHA domain-containing protein [Alcanivorax sp. 1008]